MIRVQREPFDPGAELNKITAAQTDIGGIVTFVGQVRDFSGTAKVLRMELEHYPGMTERLLTEIEAEAHRRWRLAASLIIHRYGLLAPGDPIVLVIAAAAHRGDAFDACRFLIDWLKTKAPFWKREDSGSDSRWVAAREEDEAAAKHWDPSVKRI